MVLGQVVTAPRVVRVRPSRRHCSRLYIHVCVYSSPCGCTYIYAIQDVSSNWSKIRGVFFFFCKLESVIFPRRKLGRTFRYTSLFYSAIIKKKRDVYAL